MKTFLKFMLIISVFNYSNECNSQNSERESVTVMLDLKPILQLEIKSINNIPLNLLEIKQHTPNNGINHKQGLHKDYSQDFSIANNLDGGNNIYVNKDGSLSPPSIRDKYIAGHAGSSSDIKNGYMNPGSYSAKENIINNFEYVLDYRILPNIPVLFSCKPSSL